MKRGSSRIDLLLEEVEEEISQLKVEDEKMRAQIEQHELLLVQLKDFPSRVEELRGSQQEIQINLAKVTAKVDSIEQTGNRVLDILERKELAEIEERRRERESLEADKDVYRGLKRFFFSKSMWIIYTLFICLFLYKMGALQAIGEFIKATGIFSFFD